ncbi:MAG: glycosyltransferase [Novosphingobium sp.]
MDKDVSLGIVAIGRNEGERFRRCLHSIPAGIPVVYVDSASTDGSVAFARSQGAEVVELDLSRPFTAARARNEGFARLLERWPQIGFVQFVDGDCELESEWLSVARAFLEDHPEVGAVCGRRRERYPEVSFYNRLCDEEWNTPVGSAAACGGDSLVRVRALRDAGGFDAAIVAGEEPELCVRMRAAGWAIWRLDAPMTIHDAAIHHFRQWWQRARRSGYGYAQVWHKTSRSGGESIYARELARAAFWTIGVLAVALLLALLIGPQGLLIAPLLWVAQFVRLSFAHGTTQGAHLLVGKLAEVLGASSYLVTACAKRQRGAILYK